MAQTKAGEILSKIKSLGTSDPNEITRDKIRTSGMASVIGGGMGFVYAHYNRKPVLISVFVGAFIAAIGTRLILNKIKNDASKK
ncbi:MAG: hypothetical protein RLY43_930 [Bacteroidota bacterium]|jgi:hypothetical protein